MFDIAPSELMLVGTVALVVIGPKDLPRAMHFVGQWVGRARGMARHFRSGLDEMVRQAELEEMEKKWAAENARIMAEHPPAPPEEADDALMASAVLPPPEQSFEPASAENATHSIADPVGTSVATAAQSTPASSGPPEGDSPELPFSSPVEKDRKA